MGLLVFIVAVVASAALSHAQVDKCPSYDTVKQTVYLPHPYNCSLFRRCQAGNPILAQCPAGQHFNPATSVCDDPARAKCTAAPNTCSAKTPQSTCDYKCVCDRDQQKDVCPVKLQFDAELDVIDLALAPDCDKEPSNFMLQGNKLGALAVRNATATVSMCDSQTGISNVPHFTDCTKGVLCFNGKEVALNCPPGYFYDPALGYCDISTYVNCSVSSLRLPARAGCPPDVVSKCRHTCNCDVSQGNCPARLGFTTSTNIFNKLKQPACLKGPTVIALGDPLAATLDIHPSTTKVSYCPSSQRGKSFIRDPSNCGVVTLCDRGRDRTILCPNNLSFDLKTNTCVQPDPTVCQSVAPPTVAPPSPVVPVALANITCPSAMACPAGSNSIVPHLTDCTLFCNCMQGTSTLGACPPGLHFSALLQTCDLPAKANCKTLCRSVPPSAGGTWSPSDCTASNRPEGTQCKLTCDSNHQLMGSTSVRCSKKGWDGTGGLNNLPTCDSPAVVATKVINAFNQTITELGKGVSLLFVLDESGSVGTSNFEIEKNFVSILVKAFPLSQNRTAGVITFSNPATVDIGITETNTCNFISRVKSITYSTGGTDIANALSVALTQINSYASTKGTLVFLITDGQSQTDPTSAAQMLRSTDRVLFTVGVAGYDRNQLEPISSTHTDGSKLFFGLPNYAVFQVVADYLNANYVKGSTYNCP